MYKQWGGISNKIIIKKKTNKNKKKKDESDDSDSDTSSTSPILKLPLSFSKGSSSIYSNFNHIYFNNDITTDSCFELMKELRTVETKILTLSITSKTEKQPIYLHLTTDGGLIHSAFSVIDCIKNLSVPVYTVADGFVASAGTLIFLAGEKKYMCENAYMLIHELRSGVWGKMSDIEEEVDNLKKLMVHITKIYLDNTKLKKKDLDKILKKDVIWDINECIKTGLVDEKYTGF